MLSNLGCRDSVDGSNIGPDNGVWDSGVLGRATKTFVDQTVAVDDVVDFFRAARWALRLATAASVSRELTRKTSLISSVVMNDTGTLIAIENVGLLSSRWYLVILS